MVDLDTWVEGIEAYLDGAPMDADLARARLADQCRDAQVRPMDPAAFGILAEALDLEGQARVGVLVSALETLELPVFAAIVGADSTALSGVMLALAESETLLTAEIIELSSLRKQELARKFLDRLSIGINGESARASKAALEQLDYRKLLASADLARAAADVRLKALREMSALEAQPRAKW